MGILTLQDLLNTIVQEDVHEVDADDVDSEVGVWSPTRILYFLVDPKNIVPEFCLLSVAGLKLVIKLAFHKKQGLPTVPHDLTTCFSLDHVVSCILYSDFFDIFCGTCQSRG